MDMQFGWQKVFEASLNTEIEKENIKKKVNLLTDNWRIKTRNDGLLPIETVNRTKLRFIGQTPIAFYRLITTRDYFSYTEDVHNLLLKRDLRNLHNLTLAMVRLTIVHFLIKVMYQKYPIDSHPDGILIHLPLDTCKNANKFLQAFRFLKLISFLFSS